MSGYALARLEATTPASSSRDARRSGPGSTGRPLYNLACCEALIGRKEDAVEHLRPAIGVSEQFRDYAKGDTDLDSIRDEPRFKELVGA